MIKELLFVVKMLAVTVVVLLFLQVRVGEDTIENHFHEWVQTSVFVGFFQDTADAFLVAGKASLTKATAKASVALARITKRKAPADDRSLPFQLKRHNESEDEEDQMPSASTHIRTAPRE